MQNSIYLKNISKFILLFSLLGNINISLAENKDEILTLVITANNTHQNERTTTSNTTVITADEIAQKQYKTLGEVVLGISGISVINNGGYGSATSIFVRGQSSQNLLVLENGIELNDPTGLSGANLSNLLLSDVERIEIIQGNQSVIWGANASAGVINIITKNPNKTLVSVGYGSYGLRKLSASFGKKNKRSNFIVSFSDLTTNGFSRVKKFKTSGNNLEDDGFQQTDISLKLGFKPTQKQQVKVFIKKTQAKTEFDGYDSTFTINPQDKDSYSTFNNTLRKINYQWNYNILKTDIYAQDNTIERNNAGFKFNGKVSQYGLKSRWNYAKNQFTQIALSNKQLEDNINKTSYYNTGLSLTNTNQLFNKKIIITEALRHDKYNKFNNKTTGKLGIKYYFIKDVYISANYGTAYNAPSLFHLNYKQTNNLQPEESAGYDVNFSGYGSTLTYFNQKTKNLITYSGIFPNDFYENQTGTSTYNGITLEFKRNINLFKTYVSVNYSKLTAKDNNGKWLARRPEQKAGISLEYDGLNNLLLGLENNYIGKMYDLSNQKGANIGEYTLTNLTASYKLKSTITLKTKLLNVFNKDYTQAVAAYESDAITPKYVYNSGGTQFFISIDAKF